MPRYSLKQAANKKLLKVLTTNLERPPWQGHLITTRVRCATTHSCWWAREMTLTLSKRLHKKVWFVIKNFISDAKNKAFI